QVVCRRCTPWGWGSRTTTSHFQPRAGPVLHLLPSTETRVSPMKSIASAALLVLAVTWPVVHVSTAQAQPKPGRGDAPTPPGHRTTPSASRLGSPHAADRRRLCRAEGRQVPADLRQAQEAPGARGAALVPRALEAAAQARHQDRSMRRARRPLPAGRRGDALL